MIEFKINNFITLKLQDNKTNIYVLGKEFNQRKLLLINIPIKEITSYNEISSIFFIYSMKNVDDVLKI